MKNRGARASAGWKNGIFSNDNLVIISFAIVSLVKILLSLNFYSPFIVNDELIYNDLSRRLLDGQISSPLGGYPPGYPLLLSVMNLVSSDRAIVYHLMLIVNAIISTSIIFPAYQLLKSYADERIAVLGSILVTMLPAISYYSFSLMSENLFIPLFFWTVLGIVKGLGEGSRKWQVVAGTSLTYLYLTRSIGLAMIAASVLACGVYLFLHKDQVNILAKLKSVLPFGLSLSCTLTAWVIYSTISPVATASSVQTALAYIALVGAVLAAVYVIVNRLPDRIAISKPVVTRWFAILAVLIIAVLLMAVSTAVIAFPAQGITTSSVTFAGGNAYNVVDTVTNSIQYLTSDPLLTFAVVANHLDYLFLATFFTAPFTLFCCVSWIRGKFTVQKGLDIGVVYLITALAFTLAVAVIYTFVFNELVGEWHVVLGRYLEPFIPPMITLALIFIDRRHTDDFYVSHLVMGIITLLFVLVTSASSFNIYLSLADIINNPFMLWIQPFDNAGIPWLSVILLWIICTVSISMTIKRNSRITGLILVLILCSAYGSVVLYDEGLQSSHFREGNNINKYLKQDTDRTSQLVIDTNMTNLEQVAALGVYSFWNSGSTIYSTATGLDDASHGLMISTQAYPYMVLATDDSFILYKLT